MLTTFTAGDKFAALESLPGYPASAGWQAQLKMVPRQAGDPVLGVAGVGSGESHLFSAPPATTAAWKAGYYTWVIWVERAGDSFTLATGQISIKPDLRTIAAGHDGRSLARRTLDDLLTARSEWVRTQGRVRSYSINGRAQEFADAAQLNAEIQFWEGMVRQEEAAQRLAAGKPSRNRILTRYQRPR